MSCDDVVLCCDDRYNSNRSVLATTVATTLVYVLFTIG